MEQDKVLELLEDMKKSNQKNLMYQRISTVLLLIFVVAVLMVIPSVFSTLNSAKTTLDHMDQAITEMETALGAVEGLAEDAGKAMEGVDAALQNVNSIDFETLNQAITDLRDVVEPMANFFGKFR